jgi:ribosomal protein S6--L-glutamate ligase
LNKLCPLQQDKIIPNPKSSRVLGAGDRLLCFGKLEAMRAMIPQKTRKRRIKKAGDLDIHSPVVEDFTVKHGSSTSN